VTRGGLCGVALLAACGIAGEPLPSAELGEVCGEAGPFRVLELQPGERLAETPRASDGRVVYRIGRYNAATASGQAGTPEDVALWSTGPCGESPKEIGPIVQDLLALQRWPEVLLGHRREVGDLVVLDASGATDGHVVFTGLGRSSLHVTDQGLVTFEARDEETGAALLHRYPVDPRVDTATGEVIVEGVSVAVEEEQVYPRDIQTLADELLVKNVDDALVSVALVDGTVTVEQTGVQRFSASPDGRWLLWQALSSDPEDVYQPGTVHLRDRISGDQLSLGDMFLHGTIWPFEWYVDGLFVVNADPYYNGVRRIYTLATLDFIDLTDGRLPRHVFADGRWAVGRYSGGGGVDLYDPADDSVTPLVSRGDVEWWGDDEFEVLDVPTCCSNGASLTDAGPLFRVAADGELTQIGDRVSRVGIRLGDGRRVTGLGIGGDLLGDLVLVDTDATSSSRIDGRAFAYTARLAGAFGEDTIAYSVDDGARTGVWVARLGE